MSQSNVWLNSPVAATAATAGAGAVGADTAGAGAGAGAGDGAGVGAGAAGAGASFSTAGAGGSGAAVFGAEASTVKSAKAPTESASSTVTQMGVPTAMSWAPSGTRCLAIIESSCASKSTVFRHGFRWKEALGNKE